MSVRCLLGLVLFDQEGTKGDHMAVRTYPARRMNSEEEQEGGLVNKITTGLRS